MDAEHYMAHAAGKGMVYFQLVGTDASGAMVSARVVGEWDEVCGWVVWLCAGFRAAVAGGGHLKTHRQLDGRARTNAGVVVSGKQANAGSSVCYA